MNLDEPQSFKLQSIPDVRGNIMKVYSSTYTNQDVNWNLGLTREVFFANSEKNVFRGLHAQIGEHQTDKLVVIIRGKVIDFLVDLRREKESYGSLKVFELDAQKPSAVFAPKGFAHGYFVEEEATIMYLYNNTYCSECEIVLGDSRIASILGKPASSLLMSDKDRLAFVDC